MTEGCPIASVPSEAKKIRILVFVSVLDHIVAELTGRMTENNAVLSGVTTLHP